MLFVWLRKSFGPWCNTMFGPTPPLISLPPPWHCPCASPDKGDFSGIGQTLWYISRPVFCYVNQVDGEIKRYISIVGSTHKALDGHRRASDQTRRILMSTLLYQQEVYTICNLLLTHLLVCIVMALHSVQVDCNLSFEYSTTNQGDFVRYEQRWSSCWIK